MKNFDQVSRLIAPIAKWIKEAELDDVNARCLGIFSLYYVGFRGAVIGKSSAIGCLKMIQSSLTFYCR